MNYIAKKIVFAFFYKRSTRIDFFIVKIDYELKKLPQK
jgi:hypothetical protein